MPTLELTSLAARQIAAAREWWLAHRNKAPDAFDDDLDALLGRLEDRARIVGRPVVGQTGVRRVYLKRIRYFVYFEEIDDGARVRVLALWHGSREGHPGRKP